MRCFLLTAILCVSSLVPTRAAVTPAWLGLDEEGAVVYFDKDGRQLARVQLGGPAKAEQRLDLAAGDFRPANPGPELLVLRNDGWIDVYGLPRPGQKTAKRLGYMRVVGLKEAVPVSFGVATPGKDDAGHFLAVVARGAGDRWELDTTDLPHAAETNIRVTAATLLPEGAPPLAAAHGKLATPENFVIAREDGSLESSALTRPDEWSAGRLVATLPVGTKPVCVRLVRDTLYVLSGDGKLTGWRRKPAGEWVSLGRPVQLAATVPVKSVIFLAL